MPTAIFDMDGVLYRGMRLLPQAKETLDRLRRAGWGVFYATNNSTRTRDDYVALLARLGLAGDREHVINSAYATAAHLAGRERPPRDVMVIGANGLRDEIRSVGIAVRDVRDLPGSNPPAAAAADGVDPGAMTGYLTHLALPPVADAVVVGLDLHLTYAKLAEAQRCLLGGAELICTNRDHAYPVEGRVLPGAGTAVVALELATGKRALCIGKPEPHLFAEVVRRAGPGAGPVLVVGDSPDYDMVAAHRIGAWRGSWTLFEQHWAIGSGLETFQNLFPAVRPFASDKIWTHAHNDWLQFLAETGVVGAALALWILCAGGWQAWRNLQQTSGTATGAILIGMMTGCLGLMIHGWLDFNFHVPANAANFAVLAAVLMRRGWDEI